MFASTIENNVLELLSPRGIQRTDNNSDDKKPGSVCCTVPFRSTCPGIRYRNKATFFSGRMYMPALLQLDGAFLIHLKKPGCRQRFRPFWSNPAIIKAGGAAIKDDIAGLQRYAFLNRQVSQTSRIWSGSMA